MPAEQESQTRKKAVLDADPSRIPATAVTGPASGTTGDLVSWATVIVPTDAGVYTVNLARPFVGSSMSLSAWHDEFWPVIEGSVRPATARGYAVAWRLRVKPSLGQMKLSAITPTMIEAAMARWTGSASTKIDALSLLSRLLDAARRGRLVDVNAALDVARPRDEITEDIASRALTMDEVSVVLDLIPDGHTAGSRLVSLSLACGLGS